LTTKYWLKYEGETKMIEKNEKRERYYFVVIPIAFALIILFFIQIAKHSSLKKENVVLSNNPSEFSVNTIIDRCVFELTGKPLKEVSSWVAQNMVLEGNKIESPNQ